MILYLQHLACQKNFRGQAPEPPGEQRRGGRERERGGERMEKGGVGLHHFSDQSYAPAGKHTSNNRSTTRSTTVLLLVILNVVCRVQTVTSHQQETVSKSDCRFNHANKQFFCADGGGMRNSAAHRHRRGADLYSLLRSPCSTCPIISVRYSFHVEMHMSVKMQASISVIIYN
jgi:hypothetical protein